MTLKLAPGLDLPDTFATEGVVAVGMRGSGKSNTLVRWAEVLYKARIPFVAVDPKGDWWGVKSSADGKSAGLSIPVFGGLHGDGPLDEHMGAAIADLLVDNNMSAVLDVSKLTIGKRAVFLTAFCNRLMERHQAEPHVRCVIFEEAHRYIPQQVGGGPAGALKEAAASILLEGRSFGLGCWAATQRPARLHKDVLEEVGTAFLHRIGAAATNDLRTITGWVKHEGHSDEIVPTLTSLPSGEAWVVAPATLGIAKRVRVDRRTTFDSAATPLVGAGSRPTLTLADIDMDVITDALAASIEKAKESDPAELRKRIKALERQLAQREPERVEVPVEVEVEVPVIPEALLDQIHHLEGFLRDATTEFAAQASKAVGSVIEAVKATPDRPSRSTRRTPPPDGKRDAVPAIHTRPPRPAAPARTQATTAEHPDVNPPRQKILDAIAWYASVGVNPASRSHVALVAGTSPNSSGYEKNLGALRTAGLITYPRGGFLALTPDGEAIASAGAEISTVDELIPVLADRLGKPKGRILELVAKHYPDPISREDLADEIPVSVNSSGYEKNLGGLRSLGFIEYPERGWVIATAALMIDR